MMLDIIFVWVVVIDRSQMLIRKDQYRYRSIHTYLLSTAPVADPALGDILVIMYMQFIENSSTVKYFLVYMDDAGNPSRM